MKRQHRKRFEGWRQIAEREIPAATFAYGQGGAPGLMFVAAFIPSAPMPVGIVWYGWAGEELQIQHSYVLPWARRLGVRTALHRELVRGYPKAPSVMTGGAAGKASEKWLVKLGFQKRPRGWVLEQDKAGAPPESTVGVERIRYTHSSKEGP